jgi:hypothetical protein
MVRDSAGEQARAQMCGAVPEPRLGILVNVRYMETLAQSLSQTPGEMSGSEIRVWGPVSPSAGFKRSLLIPNREVQYVISVTNRYRRGGPSTTMKNQRSRTRIQEIGCTIAIDSSAVAPCCSCYERCLRGCPRPPQMRRSAGHACMHGK